jgi:fumarylacetoacetase
MINANNPKIKSWIDIPADSDFSIQNIPFGVFRYKSQTPKLCTRLGDYIIDLSKIKDLGYFADLDIPKSVFRNAFLNDFIYLGKQKTSAVRNRISELFDRRVKKWNSRELFENFSYPVGQVEMQMPVKVGDYTDFYSSIQHATNIGKLFRDPKNALLPNWRHLPVGYHGRASSIVVSDTPFHRPKGQQMPPNADKPVFGPSKRLDFELEMAFVIGKPSALGQSINTSEAEDYIFGLTLFNDWSARDIQKWEYVPLGPFLGKSFASHVSPWIVTMDALEPFRVKGPRQSPKVLPYLQFEGERNYDIQLEVSIQPEGSTAKTVSKSNFKYMYWNMCQQLAHHTVNGCNVNVGDMMASGTISGKTKNSYGSMLEISVGGKQSIKMPDGSDRTFIEDGDTVSLQGWCEKDGVRVGFGEASAKVLPAT